MNISRIMIAAPKSGSGKTMAACALLFALKNQGRKVVSYKCGPDYIDPMFHEKVLKIPAKNLDTFFTGGEQTREIFWKHAVGNDFAVFEGVMGIYDGLGGAREEGSSYHLAKVTKTPVIFVVDAKGMGRSVIPLIAGFLAYDKEHLIRGVLLNRISRGYYEILKPLIEEELGITVVGFLPEKEELHVKSRHLGLVMPDEIKGIRERLYKASEEFIKTVSMERIMEIAGSAGELRLKGNEAAKASARVSVRESIKETVRNPEKEMMKETVRNPEKESVNAAEGDRRPVIAVARDEAFCFYYADNLQMLSEYGARLVYFSPLRDEKLPEGCHALLMGGGYPELYARELSENDKMRRSIKQALDLGMPVVAECGGFMYLHSAITDKEGVRFEMAEVVPGVCFYTGKLVRFGYVEIQEKQSHFLPQGEKIKGHEFHYYDSTCNGEGAAAVKPATGKSYPCILEDESHWMGFPHLYYPSNPAFAKSFVEKARRYAGIPI